MQVYDHRAYAGGEEQVDLQVACPFFFFCLFFFDAVIVLKLPLQLTYNYVMCLPDLSCSVFWWVWNDENAPDDMPADGRTGGPDLVGFVGKGWGKAPLEFKVSDNQSYLHFSLQILLPPFFFIIQILAS